ncbi:BMP family ABC transporter substrate-binding protein [Sutterella faecalis]|uniref:BMP family ABC transporter substrate-binding protein n=2 Tax=Sutterella TaxID=40544 RepID=A0AAI9SDZ4_9BURK|nr:MULTISPECIES: BMP family ABC transporter substrate-binding protein [Sutterella]KAB7652821.1 BMP family ABC transporter substrate-binding protein [Sutterella seckii]QDA54326.1 BMP family ABC transporter substrate-binding protein [Sutterella faecalis]
MNKRFAFKLALAGAAALVLTACGEKEAPKAPAQSTAPAKTDAAPEAKAGEPLKVAFMYVSPANEEGWSTQHDIARRAVEAKFGDKIKVTTVENIPENADAERVLRDLAQQGNKLIFATSFGYMNSVLKVAKEFPDVKFEHATGYKTADNVANYSGRFYEARYLAGKLAGATTKTNILGYVAALPIPEVLQGINAFTLGAKSVNPNVEVRVVWTSAWYDPGKESDATKSLIGQKADVITHHTNSSAVAAACEEAKIPVISYNTSMKRAAPTMLLGGVIQIWDSFYEGRIQAVMDGTWKPQSVWGGVPEHMVALVDIAKTAPQSVIDDIKAATEKMEKREFHPFTGPIVDNTGKEVLKAGQVATDSDLLTMGYLVEGVAGKLPTMN